MQKTIRLEPGGYYIIESLATGRTCYFENDQEIEEFKSLFKRYMSKYADIHKVYVSSEGYMILLKIKSKSVLLRRYGERKMKKDKKIRREFEREPWRIISEQMRIFHSVYVKMVNRKRGRKGGLVQDRYRRYHFCDESEFVSYIESMEIHQKEIQGQENRRYRVSKQWKKNVDWIKKRGVKWVESLMSGRFQSYVVSKLINFTLKAHKTPLHPS